MESPITARAAIIWALGMGEAYGGLIASRVSDHTGKVVLLADGTLYPTLRILVEQELVVEKPTAPGSRIRVYDLTMAGRAELDLLRRTLHALAFARPKPPPRRRSKKAKQAAAAPAAPAPAVPAAPAPAVPAAPAPPEPEGAAPEGLSAERWIEREPDA